MATLFHSSFVRKKKDILQRNIQYVYNFYGTDLKVNIWGGVLRTQSNIYGEASL